MSLRSRVVRVSRSGLTTPPARHHIQLETEKPEIPTFPVTLEKYTAKKVVGLDADNTVTIDAPAGQVTLDKLTSSPNSTMSFTLNSNVVKSTSVVVCTLLYSGTYGKDGMPVVSVNNVKNGSFKVNITNMHADNQLNGVVKVNFIVV